jgi:riboflavin biosynthesis pyrimidine reductase
MTAEVLPLYPTHNTARPVKGLYLAHRLHELGSAESPLVCASFVSSLDGRIAVRDAAGADANVLEGLTSPNDFRLFLELEAQADCLITHGGYMRALAQGRLGNVLQITAPDLAEWRKQNGLPQQPAIVIASGSLDFPIHESIAEHGQPLYIATGRAADPGRIRALRERGLHVILAGEGTTVQGAPLVSALGLLGYRCQYLLAGPLMLETMLRDRQLARLYLTMRHRLLGGKHFHTMIEGPSLSELGELALRSLHYDAGEGQWFAQFEPTHRGT